LRSYSKIGRNFRQMVDTEGGARLFKKKYMPLLYPQQTDEQEPISSRQYYPFVCELIIEFERQGKW
jgi:hypothetical protein